MEPTVFVTVIITAKLLLLYQFILKIMDSVCPIFLITFQKHMNASYVSGKILIVSNENGKSNCVEHLFIFPFSNALLIVFSVGDY